MYEEEFEFRGLTLLDAVSQATGRRARLRERKMDTEKDIRCLQLQARFERLMSRVERYADLIADLEREIDRVRSDRRANLTDAAIDLLTSASGAFGVAKRTLGAIRRFRQGAEIADALLTILPLFGAASKLHRVLGDNADLRRLIGESERAERQGQQLAQEAQNVVRESQRIGCELIS